MVTSAVLHHSRPVVTAKGWFHTLDIYEDHLIIHRTDLISRLFSREDIIFFKDIKRLYAYSSYFLFNNWSQLVIVTHTGKTRSLSYATNQQHIALHIKEIIEDYLSRREIAPLMKALQKAT